LKSFYKVFQFFYKIKLILIININNKKNPRMTEKDYIAQLNAMEQKVLNIARTHLETSFSLKKSIGFQEWQKAQAQQAQAQANEVQASAEQAPNEVAPNEVQASAVQAPPAVIIKRKRKIKIAASTKLLAV